MAARGAETDHRELRRAAVRAGARLDGAAASRRSGPRGRVDPTCGTSGWRCPVVHLDHTDARVHQNPDDEARGETDGGTETAVVT